MGAAEAGPLGVLVVNASTRARVLRLEAAGDELFDETAVELGVVPALGVMRVAVPQRLRDDATVPAVEPEDDRRHGRLARALRLTDEDGAVVAEAEVSLRVVAPDALHVVTRVSPIDGSVQYHAVLPEEPVPAGVEPTLVLTLHGAGASGRGQAGSHSRRPGVRVVGPTNRRTFGFDWQDWGRQDAYEALAYELQRSGISPRRVQVTGHSMGGHGSWHLAANDADGFSAVAPSAGWASFDTYGGRPQGELTELWHAADGGSLTFELLPNLVQTPAFVLHGDADDNVPPTEGERMLEVLREAGAEPRSHFEPGKKHWWNGDAAPGVDCVDWPGVFELFAEHPEVPVPDRFDAVSVGPGVDPRHLEFTVAQVRRWGERFRLTGERREEGDGTVLALDTENVRRLAVEVSPRLAGARLVLDGAELGELPAEVGAVAWFLHGDDGWASDGPPPPGRKHPGRCGPFKRAFDNGFVLVYGTAGGAEETRWLAARARQDASVWRYRANGRAPVLSDVEWLARGAPAGNVILYGNADTNGAWDTVLAPDAPLTARRGALTLGEHRWEADDVAATVVLPRRDDPEALVGVFADTGPRATRLGFGLLTFVSGVGLPDYAVFDADVLLEGDGGVLAAGWFDHRWRPEAGGFVRGD